ncbi:MAG: DUF523 and DUF1722 domain-containing protein [Desulfohalobiaceae bacterium]|nr:DUF523 and DUF1722 domain-containing protein [Desulfohalobiaceae bacterium]
MEKISLGVSKCLLGHPVRYDGGHKLNRYVRDTLGHYFEYFPICPEVECGMPVPREALHLVGDPGAPRLRTRKSRQDYTEQMQTWGRNKLEELAEADLCGYIFKSRSPSSGMERIKVYNEQGSPAGNGVGIWARMVMERFPFLPVEDEGRLHDPGLREHFIEHVFLYWRWRQLEKQGPDLGALTDFHSRHKLLLLAHSPELYKEMGRYVAQARSYPREEILPGYLRLLDQAMRTPTTIAKHANVLHHMLGYFKQELSADEKQEFLDMVEKYRQGSVPLIVPVTLMNHFVRKYNEPYLSQQIYLNPHPVELKLRNQA